MARGHDDPAKRNQSISTSLIARRKLTKWKEKTHDATTMKATPSTGSATRTRINDHTLLLPPLQQTSTVPAIRRRTYVDSKARRTRRRRRPRERASRGSVSVMG